MGKSLGHCFFNKKLAPTISPNKTIEGLLFGISIMTIISLPLGIYLTNFSYKTCLLLALSSGLLGVCGDLLVSKIKRNHNIKDTGYWLKGHGGLLDRIDSLLLILPIALLFI